MSLFILFVSIFSGNGQNTASVFPGSNIKGSENGMYSLSGIQGIHGEFDIQKNQLFRNRIKNHSNATEFTNRKKSTSQLTENK